MRPLVINFGANYKIQKRYGNDQTQKVKSGQLKILSIKELKIALYELFTLLPIQCGIPFTFLNQGSMCSLLYKFAFMHN